MFIPTWQERCGIDADRDPAQIEQQTLRRAMQAEIDDLRVAFRWLQAIATAGSLHSVSASRAEMSRFDTVHYRVRNIAVEARRVLQWATEWPASQGNPRLERLREVIENLQQAVDQYDNHAAP